MLYKFIIFITQQYVIFFFKYLHIAIVMYYIITTKIKENNMNGITDAEMNILNAIFEKSLTMREISIKTKKI